MYALLIILFLGVAAGQTCNPGDSYICLNLNHYVDCGEPDTLSNCNSVPLPLPDHSTCYPGFEPSKTQPCREKQAACTASGSFAVKLADVDRKDLYYTCVSTGPGTWSQHILACQDNLEFNQATQSCGPDTTATTPSPGSCVSNTFMSYLSDCKRYQECVYGTWKLRTCLFSTYYNAATNTCSTDPNVCGTRPK